MSQSGLARFGAEYARHRAAEGRGHSGAALIALPYLADGPLARQWSVRARSFEGFLAHVLRPMAARLDRPLTIADIGAGNGWLSHRVAREGHRAVAVDLRDDDVDGLGAARKLAVRVPGRMGLVAASFDALPLAAASVDIALFNASLHYATDLSRTLIEACRAVRPGGAIVILDSPFYDREQDGLAMVREKHDRAAEHFGDRAGALLALPFVEFLTRERLTRISQPLGLVWRRRRLLYPLWYELRPVLAALGRRRPPSRFDLWTAVRP